MGIVPSWKQKYFMALDNTGSSGMTLGAYSSAETTPYPVVYLTNKPEFNPNQDILNTDKATGYPYPIDGSNDIERTLGYETPETSYEFELDVPALFIPAVTLLQPSSGEVAKDETNVKTIKAYNETAEVSKYAHLFRVLDAEQDEQIMGAIANSITISGAEGEVVTFSVDWSGKEHDQFASSGTNLGSFSGDLSDPLISFDDVHIAIAPSDATLNASDHEIDMMSFELSMNNNNTSRHYNKSTVQRHILGNLDIGLTLTIPFSETNADATQLKSWLESLENIQVVITNNDDITVDPTSGLSNGEFYIKLHASMDTKTTEDNEEVDNTIELTGISYWDESGSSHENPLKIYLKDGVDRTNYF
jgi:hypothetical protein